MTLKWSFACMFSTVCQQRNTSRRIVTHLICRARCSLLVKLRLQGGYSVHQNLCDFFFLVDCVPSALTLSSSSDPSCPSSESSISTSSESRDFVERCES